MASLSPSTWFSSLHTSIPAKSILCLSSNARPSSFRPLHISASAMGRPNDDTSAPSSSDTPESPEESKPDKIKLEFEKAREYKSLKVDGIQQNRAYPEAESPGILGGSDGFASGGEDERPIAVDNRGRTGESENSSEDGDSVKEEIPEALIIAMEKAKDYKKNKGKLGDNESDDKQKQISVDAEGGKEEVPEAIRIALEKAKEYKKNKGTIADGDRALDSSKWTVPEGEGSSRSQNGSTERKTGKKEDLKISSIDFAGLNFVDKKQTRGLPAGLVPISDPFPEGDLPEVEILVGDTSKFGSAPSSETQTTSDEENSELYKPKVSTWGVFPRPSNISKTFGGGKNIRPGQSLESPEDKAAKEARTKQLVAAYKRKIGLNMDPKLRAECEEALKDGDSLMDMGKLNEALPCYQQVMDKLAFQTELHGLAALQWSICQDSLSRPEQARIMYEKLQSHPNAQVSKRARQFMFSFQAMEMMKVTRSKVSPRNTGYQNYFEAFVEDRENYTSGSEEGAGNQALPYILFLASPILLVLLMAATKGS